MAYVDPQGNIVAEEGDTLRSILRDVATDGADPSDDVIGSWQLQQFSAVGGLLPVDVPLGAGAVLVPPPASQEFFRGVATDIYGDQMVRTPDETPPPRTSTPSRPTGTPNQGVPVSAPPDPRDNAAFQQMQMLLESYGLGSLSDFLWERFVEGDTPIQIDQKLRETREFKDRFFAIDRLLSDRGIAVSPEEVIEFEVAALQIFDEAGFPNGFYDSTRDVQELFARGYSVRELANLTEQALRFADAADPALIQAAESFFGSSAPNAIAAFAFDRDLAVPALTNLINQAELTGEAGRFGFRLGRRTAARLAEAGFGPAQARERFAFLNRDDIQALRVNRPGEANQIGGRSSIGLGTAIDEVFLGVGNALENRAQSRLARFAGRTGIGIVPSSRDR